MAKEGYSTPPRTATSWKAKLEAGDPVTQAPVKKADDSEVGADIATTGNVLFPTTPVRPAKTWEQRLADGDPVTKAPERQKR